ncbi:MAG: hypothetical protein MUF00_08255 [Gemmatimonadaceae bacterium]|jgi:hypothetical protein|nr:hypothetical protein [Gemmatimonadaceae bacterium]
MLRRPTEWAVLIVLHLPTARTPPARRRAVRVSTTRTVLSSEVAAMIGGLFDLMMAPP